MIPLLIGAAMAAFFILVVLPLIVILARSSGKGRRMTAALKFYLCVGAILICVAAAVRIENVRAGLDLGTQSGLTTVLNAAQRAVSK